jgi:hypothetical protein
MFRTLHPYGELAEARAAAPLIVTQVFAPE